MFKREKFDAGLLNVVPGERQVGFQGLIVTEESKELIKWI